jgi:hypothetical protein
MPQGRERQPVLVLEWTRHHVAVSLEWTLQLVELNLEWALPMLDGQGLCLGRS